MCKKDNNEMLLVSKSTFGSFLSGQAKKMRRFYCGEVSDLGNLSYDSAFPLMLSDIDDFKSYLFAYSSVSLIPYRLYCDLEAELSELSECCQVQPADPLAFEHLFDLFQEEFPNLYSLIKD